MLKILETTTKYTENFEYTEGRNELDKIYKKTINSVRIRSKSDWYKYGKKFFDFFSLS